MHIINIRFLSELIPPAMQTELGHLYSALRELLRHFWACFPTTSKQLDEKVTRDVTLSSAAILLLLSELATLDDIHVFVVTAHKNEGQFRTIPADET